MRQIDESTIARLSRRDQSIDFIRAFAIVFVVFVHASMVGLYLNSQGQPALSNPLTDFDWFADASTFGQIMPLFFVAGGFAAWHAWQSMRSKGGTWSDFIQTRALRLLYPVAVFYLIILVITTAVRLTAPTNSDTKDLVNFFLMGCGMPLWFVVAYLITQTLVPALARAHELHPYLTISALFGAVLAVDAVSYQTGFIGLRYLNMILVWPLIQQIGFFIAKPTFSPNWMVLVVTAVAAFWLTNRLQHSPYYAHDMLTNLNPPTLLLFFVGVAHASIFVLLRPGIRRIMRWRPLQVTVGVIGTRGMTIYLWHLPVAILISALVFVFPGFIPVPADGGAWWAWRFASIFGVFAIVLVLSIWLAKFERGPQVRVNQKPQRILAGVLIGLIPPVFSVTSGMDYVHIAWGTIVLGVSIFVLAGSLRMVSVGDSSELETSRSRIG